MIVSMKMKLRLCHVPQTKCAFSSFSDTRPRFFGFFFFMPPLSAGLLCSFRKGMYDLLITLSSKHDNTNRMMHL